MKTFLPFLLLCWVVAGPCFGRSAQNGFALSPDSIVRIGPDQRLGFEPKKHSVWLNIGQLGFMEHQISYERRFAKDWALEATAGFKFPKQLDKPYSLAMRSVGPAHFYDYIAWFPYSAGLLAGGSVKKYVTPAEDVYVAASYFYRYWFYNNQTLDSHEMVSQTINTFNTTHSLRMHVHGVKILVGCIIGRFPFPGNKALVVDFYAGGGYRTKKVTLSPEMPAFADGLTETVSVQAGLKLGLNF